MRFRPSSGISFKSIGKGIPNIKGIGDSVKDLNFSGNIGIYV